MFAKICQRGPGLQPVAGRTPPPGLPALPALAVVAVIDMPGKDSKARLVATVARWLEWRCVSKWQLAVVINTGQYRPGEHEELVDSFLTEDGPADQKQIAARIKQFSLGELRALATAADRKAFLFQRGGRPRQINYDPQLVTDVEQLMSDRRIRARDACERLVTYRKPYQGVTAEALRQRYLKAKKSLP
jgi:hypothetical protein